MSEPGLFAKESSPYAPFKTVGTEYSGTVLRTGRVQQREFVPEHRRQAGVQGDLEWWDDAKTQPKWVAIITIQTDLRDPEIPGDDGQRSIWVSGKQMTDAAKKAVKDAGATKTGIVPGGYFSMKFTHTTPNDWTDTPTKHYEATYRPPVTPGAFADAGDPWAQPQNPFPPAGGDPSRDNTQQTVADLLRRQQQGSQR